MKRIIGKYFINIVKNHQVQNTFYSLEEYQSWLTQNQLAELKWFRKGCLTVVFTHPYGLMAEMRYLS